MAYESAAGFGEAGYVLGTSTGGPAVWRTKDGNNWETIVLPGYKFAAEMLDIEAGPLGLAVVATEDQGEGLRTIIWHSRDGRAFDEPHEESLPALSAPGAPMLSADADGFTLVGRAATAPVIFTSEDGIDWQQIDSGLDGVDWLGPAATTAAGRVTFGYISPEPYDSPKTTSAGHTSGLGVWVRPKGQARWHRSSELDPGHLPDSGVGPMEEAGVAGIATIGAQLLAVGYEGRAGAVWTSRDGTAWSKEPTTANRFNDVGQMDTVAVSDKTVLLLGSAASTKIWLGHVVDGHN